MILKKKNLVVAIIYLILLICASIYANKRLGNPFSGAGDFSGCLFIFAFILAIIFIPFIFLIPALPIILLLKVMFTEKCLKCKSGKMIPINSIKGIEKYTEIYGKEKIKIF